MEAVAFGIDLVGPRSTKYKRNAIHEQSNSFQLLDPSWAVTGISWVIHVKAIGGTGNRIAVCRYWYKYSHVIPVYNTHANDSE